MADPAGASRSRRAARSKPKVALASTVPAPPAVLHITPVTWKAGTALHRVHLNVYAADAFIPGIKGNARFSPIVNAAGKTIPTLYGGTSFICAAMETVFHDVPFAPGFKTFDRHKLEGQLHSVLAITATLTLADLRNVPLRKLGVERKQLIDTEKDTYRQTRKWAQMIHAQHVHIQGLCWTSRQDDSAMALMLFGDRIGAGVLAQQGLSRSLLDDAAAIMELLALADMLGFGWWPVGPDGTLKGNAWASALRRRTTGPTSAGRPWLTNRAVSSRKALSDCGQRRIEFATPTVGQAGD